MRTQSNRRPDRIAGPAGLGLGSATGLSLWALSSDVAFLFLGRRSCCTSRRGAGARWSAWRGWSSPAALLRTSEDGKPAASFPGDRTGAEAVTVKFVGIPCPDLFREGSGRGDARTLAPDGSFFAAQEVLAKHDEDLYAQGGCRGV